MSLRRASKQKTVAQKTATQKMTLQKRVQTSWYRLQSLDSQYYGSWPVAIKTLIVGVLLLTLALVAYLFPIRSKQQQLSALQDQQQVLWASYQQKRIQADAQQAYLQQTEQARKQLQQLSGQLVTEAQLTELMEAINKVAVSSGVVLQDMALNEEYQQDRYILQPIDMVVVGGYHNFGLFLSGLSALPRLLMVQDFSVSHSQPLLIDPQHLSLVLHTQLYRLKSEQVLALDSDLGSELDLDSELENTTADLSSEASSVIAQEAQ